MKSCPNCGYELNEGKFCVKCGQSLENPDTNNIQQDNSAQSEEVTNQNQVDYIPEQESAIQTQQTFEPQQYEAQQPSATTDNYQQGNYQQYNNYQNNQAPLNQKSKAVGLILNIILVGLGYAYVGKWGEGLVLLVVYLLLWFLGFLIFPIIIAIGLWIYSLIKTNEMIDKYNAGLPY